MATVSRVAVITLNSATLGSRTWRAEATVQDTAAGQLVTINFTQSTTGASPPGTANATRDLIMKDDAGNTIRTFSWAEGAASDTFQFYLTNDGTNTGSARCGTVGMTLRVTKTNGGPAATYDVESDGSPNTPPTGFTTSAADVGWIRGTTTASVKVNKSALVDPAFTGTYAYPDSLFVRVTLGARAYVTGRTIRVNVGSGTLTSSVSDPNADSAYDASFSQAVDYRFPASSSSQTVTADNLANASLTGSAWTVLTVTPQVLTVDPRVTLGSETSTSGGLEKVYNRGELVSGTVDVTNARGEGFAPRGTATLQLTDGGSPEESVSFSRSGATYTWSRTFASSGNTAPASDAGSAKKLRWRDSVADSPTPDDSATVGFLSSKLNLAVHMQARQTSLNPSLNTTERLASEIGYYGFKVTNVRGEAYNGAVGVVSLRPDDDSLAQVDSSSLTSQTINGHVGYTPLQTWLDPLPDGGWDIWASTSFVKDGNTGTKARSGASVFDVSLVANNPALVVVRGAGMVGGIDDHFSHGESLVVGATLLDTTTQQLSAPDSGVVRMVRFNTATALPEYLDSDEQTWVSMTSPTQMVHEFALSVSPSNAAVLLRTFDAADTALWGDAYDVFPVFTLDLNGSPYHSPMVTSVTGKNNLHGGSVLDAVALATAGIISFK